MLRRVRLLRKEFEDSKLGLTFFLVFERWGLQTSNRTSAILTCLSWFSSTPSEKNALISQIRPLLFRLPQFQNQHSLTIPLWDAAGLASSYCQRAKIPHNQFLFLSSLMIPRVSQDCRFDNEFILGLCGAELVVYLPKYVLAYFRDGKTVSA
jgi:hypothetical protein